MFIDDKLALDIGGAATPERQYVALDRLELVDGQVYTLSFFYAHRLDAITSRFNVRTNVQLFQTFALPTVTASYD